MSSAIRNAHVPTGALHTKAGRSRLFASAFDHAVLETKMVDADHATPTSGWGPMIRIKSARSTTTEVIHGHSTAFVMIDYPTIFPDRIAIRRKGTRHDSAGSIYIEVPAGAGPQVAAFLHAFAHLPGSVPQKLHPPREAFEAPPSRIETGGGSFSVEFYAYEWSYAHPGPKGQEPQPSEHRVHVVATGDPRAKTASLTIRRDTDPTTWTKLDLSEATVTMMRGAYNRFAILVTLRSTDSDGATASFQRHLHPVLGFSSVLGPPAADLTTVVSTAAMCTSASTIAGPPDA